MNLLLLLSALLSALTGVGASVRAPGAVQQVTASRVAARVAPAVRQVTAARPVAALPGLRALALDGVRAVVVVASVPLWASRRRE